MRIVILKHIANIYNMFKYKRENNSMIAHCFVLLWFLSSGLEAYVFNYEEALLGDTRTLPCDLEDGYIGGWDHVPVGSSNIFEVMIGLSPTLEYADRFAINSNSAYELVIKNVRKEDAGIYFCNTQNQQKNRKFNLTVLESAPVCSSTSTPLHPVAENDCGISSDTIVVSCKVNYFGVFPPNLRWENIDGGDIEITPSEEKSTVSITFQTVVKWNVREYKCMTKELSCHSVIPRPLYAFNNSETISIKWPQKITCSANTSQLCSYKWFHQEKVVSTGEDLDLTQESSAGEYRCLAECEFKGNTCILEAHVLTYAFAIDTAKKNSDISTIVIVVVASVVSTLMAITILYMICKSGSNNRIVYWIRKTKKNRNTERLLSVTAMDDSTDACRLGSLKSGIRGIAIVNDTIYIVREFSKQIESYNSGDYRKESEINVPFLDCPWGMAACERHRLLYVSEFNNDFVVLLHKIELKKGSATFFQLSKDFLKAPVHVSVTRNQTVMISGSGTNVPKVMEYSSDGTKIREILLDGTLTGVRRAILLNDGSILLASAWFGATNQNKICKVDPDSGSILSYYGGSKPGIGGPADIVLNEEETSIFVSISDRMCVLMLNSSLEIEDNSYLKNAKLGYPFRLAFDGVRQRLYVGDYSRGIQCINITGSEDTLAFADNITGDESRDASILELKKIYDSEKKIVGMTILDNRLYTVTANSKQVDEFNLGEEITKTRSISVEALNSGFGMAACGKYKCLYISEYTNTAKIVGTKMITESGLVIHKVELETNETSQFPISHDFRDDWVNVSVTKLHNVLVLGTQCSMLEEYDTNGNLLRTIPLDTNLKNIQQACWLDDVTVLIARGLLDQKNRGICKVNSVTGEIGERYKSYNGYFTDMLVSDKKGLVFVLVAVKNLVSVFTLDLKKIRDIDYFCVTGFMPTLRLAIDDTNDKLYVGSFVESQYVLVIDIRDMVKGRFFGLNNIYKFIRQNIL